MNPQPFIAVRDVEVSGSWYQKVLGLVSGHGGPEYEQLMSQGLMAILDNAAQPGAPADGKPLNGFASAEFWRRAVENN